MKIQDKNMQPELRFIEFSGNWAECKIGDVLKIGSGRDYKHLTKGDIPVYGTGGLMCYVNDMLYDGETVFIGRKGTINKPYYFNGKFWTVDTLFYTHSFFGAHVKFTYGIFQRINWKKHNEASGVPSLSKTTIEALKISIPCLAEQTKIANFLSTVDDKITNTEKQLKLFKDYKKGMMQRIFSQEIRFKDDDGGGFCDWVDVELGEILDYLQPTKYIVKSTEYSNNNITPVLTAGKSLYLGYTNETHGIFENYPVIIFDDFTTANKYINFRFKVKSSAMKLLTIRNKNNSLKYIFETIQEIKFIVGGHERHWISKYSYLTIPLPCTQEQTKIANFLSTIDEKVEIIDKSLAQLKLFKKSLLQRMFV
jgi:type I restriction enzyme S subunit